MRFCTLAFAALLLAVAGAGLSAQTVRTLGSSASGNNVIPFNHYSSTWGQSARYQTAYSATEINLGAATLTEIRVYMAGGSATTYSNFRCRVAHTTSNPGSLSATFANNYTGSLSTVIGDTGTSSPVNFTPTTSGGYAIFQLTNNWSYNGTDGILVDWSYDGMASSGFNIHSPSGRTRVYAYNTGTNSYLTTSGSTSTAGNWQIQFVFQTGPNLTATVTPGAAQNVYANDTGNGDGIEAGTFEIASNSQTGASLTQIELSASGTGDDSADYSEVAVYRDSNGNGSFDSGTDTLIGTAVTAFNSNNGTATFNVQASEQSFSANETRDYFVVVKLSGSASPTETFNFQVSDITVTGTNAGKSGLPSSTINGLVIDTPDFAFADASPATAQTANLGSSGNVVQVFTISYPNGPDDKPDTVTITGLGTADESTDLSDVELYHDSNSNGTYDAGTDTLIDNGSYTLDNGTVAFDMSSHADFQAGDTRTYFVVYDLNTNASDSETFKTYVSAASGTSGATYSGLPTPGTNGTAGLTVSANALAATLNGPGTASTVNSDSTGGTGDGELLCDVTLDAAAGGAWTVSDLTFVATGTGDHDTAFSEVALYEDTNGNGSFDGAGTDTLAAPAATAFGASPGYDVTFTFNNSSFPANTSRRFFLVGKLNGTATSGETFNARLDSATTTPPTGGVTVGFPTSNSTALIIDVTSLSVTNGASAPADFTHKSGTALAHVIAKFEMTASNNDVQVSGVTLTTAGSGDWTTDLDAVSGVEVWQDDGDGVFDATTDTSLFSGAGSATVNAAFSSNVTVGNASSETLWVRLNVLATAGSGLSSPIDFSLSVANAGDVNAGGTTVLLGTPVPDSSVLKVVDFFVNSFTPLTDVQTGGAAITIGGSGFEAPLTVTIGGVVCPGTPNVTPTQVTGLVVPPGSGSNLPIVVTSGTLAPQTLSQTFDYPGGIVSGGGGGGGGGGGCVGNANTSWALLLGVLGALALAASFRRRLS